MTSHSPDGDGDGDGVVVVMVVVMVMVVAVVVMTAFHSPRSPFIAGKRWPCTPLSTV